MKFKLVDLTHTIAPDMPVYPGDNQPVLSTVRNYRDDGYLETEMLLSTHTGTHMDSPRHFYTNLDSTDSKDLNSFFGTAVVIDCSDQKGEISPDFILRHKDKLSHAEFVLFRTGFDQYWGTEQYFHNFPILHFDSASHLVSLGIKGVGFDTCSADSIDSVNYPVHQLLLKNNMVIVENLCGLSNLPAGVFYFSCFPLKIAGGDGSPVRAVAYIPV